MYCEQCGARVSPQAKFCSGCGARVVVPAQAIGPTSPIGPARPLAYAATSADRIPPGEPVRVARPVFVGWVTIVSVLPIQLFMTVWAGGFCGGFSMFAVQGLRRWFGLHLPAGSTFAFFAALAFFGIPLGTYTFKRKTYARTEYRLFRDRLEYYEGFWTIQQKTLDYRSVIEVDLKKGVVQRRYGLGTILLSTPATGLERKGQSPGVRLNDVPDPDGLYEELKQLVRKARDREPGAPASERLKSTEKD